MNMAYRFYNPGLKIFETVPFDKPNPDNNKEVITGQWGLLAEKESFFDAPAMIEVPNFGMALTNFDKTIVRKWADRGIILIDPKKDDAEGSPYAPTEERAKEKGDALYYEYEMRLVQGHINNAEKLKSMGMSCGPATGFIKHVLTKFNIADPGKSAENMLFNRKATEQDAGFAKQLAEQAQQIKMLTELLQPKGKHA